MTVTSSTFNPHQQRRLKVTCEHIDRLLSDVEAILHASESKSPFPRYAADISVPQRRMLENYIAQMRSLMVRILERQRIAIDPPSIPASHAVNSNLTFIDISVEELRPRYMRGYGKSTRKLPPNSPTSWTNSKGC